MSQDSLLFFDRNRNLKGDSALNKINWYLGQKNKFFVFELVLASFFRFLASFIVENDFMKKNFKFHLQVGFLGPPASPLNCQAR